MRLTLLLAYLMFLLFSFGGRSAVAQSASSAEQTVTGRVTDSEGIPLVGVRIMLKSDPRVGTLSDETGTYQIEVQSDDAILVFSYLNHFTQEVAVEGKSTLDVTLSPDDKSLDEVVVVGYGTQKRVDLTGSLAAAPLEAFEESPNTNILQALSGSTPGISIGQTAAAGEEPSIQIRGQASLNGNLNPLIILDGVYYRGRLADLNPKDIQSVNVLKDASSKAIYGAQAANGVILVTTKSGKTASKPVISYSGFYATQTPANELTPNGREAYLRGVRDIDWQNGYLAPDYLQENPDWTIVNNTGLFAPLLEGFANGTNYNWYDEVTDPGFITDHQLSVRGRSSNTSYFLSGGYTDQQGWMLNDNYQRITARINVDIDITNWLTLGANTFGAFSDYSGESPNLGGLPQMSPLAAPRDAEGQLIINPLGDNRLNPFLSSATVDRDLRNNLSGIFYANVRVPQVPGLSYRVNFSHNYRWDDQASSSIYEAGLAGRATKLHRSTYDVLLDHILTYDRELGEDHGINATLLYGFNQVNFDQTRATGTNYSNLILSYNSLQQAVIPQIFSGAWQERFLYQMARLNYNFRQKYLLTATVRRDGFSGFAANNKFGVFPSLGAGWVLSEEGFMQAVKAVDFLKLRATYGINGNLTSRYSSLAIVEAGTGSQYVFDDGGSPVVGQQITSLANPDLSWEKTAGINLGVDFSLWNDRLSGSLDYYQSTTTDLLWNFILPQVTGFRTITSNVGELSNRGLELLLSATPVSYDQLTWSISLNGARNQNRIERLLGLDLDEDGQEDDLVANNLFIGESIGTIYSYEIEGLWQIGDDDIPDGWAPGQYKLVDQNGDGVITPQDDRKILGRQEPAYEFGIQNTLRFRDFTFRFFIKSVQGGQNSYLGENNPWAGGYGTPGTAQASNWFSEIDYWNPANQDATFRLPGPAAAIGGRRFFSRSFVRLQDISLAYNLPSSLIERLNLQNVKVFVSGKNLLTFTSWEGWDPETGQGLGATQGRALPVMRGLTAGLDFSL